MRQSKGDAAILFLKGVHKQKQKNNQEANETLLDIIIKLNTKKF